MSTSNYMYLQCTEYIKIYILIVYRVYQGIYIFIVYRVYQYILIVYIQTITRYIYIYRVVYRVSQDCDWACYYHISGLDLETYPNNRLAFSYKPHIGQIPDRYVFNLLYILYTCVYSICSCVSSLC